MADAKNVQVMADFKNDQLDVDAPTTEFSNEGYPKNWLHCKIHLNPETMEMHSDGDHRVRNLIQKQIGNLESELAFYKNCASHRSTCDICGAENVLVALGDGAVWYCHECMDRDIKAFYNDRLTNVKVSKYLFKPNEVNTFLCDGCILIGKNCNLIKDLPECTGGIFVLNPAWKSEKPLNQRLRETVCSGCQVQCKAGADLIEKLNDLANELEIEGQIT